MYPITSRFSQHESFRLRGHSGIDFSMPKSTPLRSIKEGIISKISDYGNFNSGKCIQVRWEDCQTAIYGHLSRFNPNIKVGDHVNAGDIIGYSGNSGHVVGANGGYHLHFGLKNEHGEFIDPSAYVDQIQNMNSPQWLASLSHSPYIIHHASYSLMNLLKDTSNIYSDFFHTLKINLIHIFTSIDYTMFMQCFKDLFQLFS